MTTQKHYQVINRHNLSTLVLKLRSDLSQADFISIDTEFTGLGDKLLKHQNIEQRYLNSRDLVISHSILSMGITIFNDDKAKNYLFLLLNTREHKICPKSMSFLREHGFDFNDLYDNGIPYHCGLDCDETLNKTLRDLMSIVFTKKVVVHNGFLDLLFIYHSFYNILPKSLPTFVQDLSDLFTMGVYDTKYMADYIKREPSSFLELLYTKFKRENIKVEIVEPKGYKKQLLTKSLVELGLKDKSTYKEGKLFYCEQYAVIVLIEPWVL